MIRLHHRLAWSLLATTGCFGPSNADGVGDSFQDDDPPIGGCSTGTGPCGSGTAEGGGAAVGSPCDNTNQCGDGGVCVAPFSDGDPGGLVCQLGCVQIGDAASWCSDDAACCSGVCGPRGLCLTSEPDPADATGAGSGSDGGSTSTGGTSTDGTSTDGTSTGGASTGGASTGGASTTGGSG